MRGRRPAFLAAVVAAALVAAGCSDPSSGSSAATAGFPMTYDSCGTPVTLTRPPQKVLTLAVDNSTTMAAIGAVGKLAARAAEGGAPLGQYAQALAAVPQLSDNDEPSREAMIGAQIDTLLSYDGLRNSPQDLQAAGITTLYPSWRCGTRPVGFDDVFSTMDALGTVFGTRATADAAVGGLRQRVDAATSAAAGRPRLTAAVLYVDATSLRAYGSLSLAQSILDKANLANVFADVPKRISEVNVETVLARNPQVVVLAYGGSETAIKTDADAERVFRALPSAATLGAVTRNQLIPINFSLLVGGPTSVDGLETVVSRRTAFS